MRGAPGTTETAISSDDPFDLARFVEAQARVYATVVGELRRGRKETHWIWFIFPQLKSLGRSPTALRYGVSSAAEAKAYLGHPVLGPRLRECAALLRDGPAENIQSVMGFPDDLKLKSSMTLFAEVATAPEDTALFLGLIERFFEGTRDDQTLRLLHDEPS